MKLIRLAKQFGIDWILVGVGVIDTYLSVYLTYAWQVYVGDRPLEALIFSLVIVLFAIIIFEFAVRQTITLKADGRRHWSSPVLFLLWLLVVSYSMQSTTAGQYINVMKDQIKNLESQTESKTASLKADLLKQDLVQIDKEISGYETRISQLETILQGVDSVEKMFEWKKTTGTVQSQWNELQDLLRSARTRRAELSEQLRQASITAKIEELKGSGTDVFAFYSQVLGIEDTSKVQFALAVFKGIILDLINVICFMLVMLREKWRNEHESTRSDLQHERHRTETVPTGDRTWDPLAEGPATEPELRETSTPVERLAAYLYRAGGQNRNGTFISQRRAFNELGISPEDYQSIVRRGLLHGVLRRYNSRTFLVAGYSEAEFIAETSTD